MKNFSRRLFLQNLGMGAGAAAVAATLPSFIKIPGEHHELYDGKKLNIAICGLGNYGSYLAECLATAQYCRLAGIVTGHPEKAEKWKKNSNIPQKNIYNYQNFDEIANNKDIFPAQWDPKLGIHVT